MFQSAIIIVNYNTSLLTTQTVQSLTEKCNVANSQIIIVDNGSEYDDYSTLKDNLYNLQLSNILLHRSRINTGFSGGNMLGVQFANAQYYVFLNSDVLFEEDPISPMINYLENHSEVSIIGCQSKDENGNFYKPFDYKIGVLNELLPDNLLTKLFPKQNLNRKKPLNKPTEVDAVPGSLFICNSKDFDSVGGLDTNMFLYYEEKDLAYRIQKQLKKKIISLPNVSYIHLKGKSTKPSIHSRLELKISQFYTIRKNLPFYQYIIFYIYTFILFNLKGWFSSKNRAFLKLLWQGMPLQKSLKLKQKIQAI